MAAGIHDIYNGRGFVYMVAPNGTDIQAWVGNTVGEVRPFRINGGVTAPFAAKRSAYGSITFTMGVAGAGSITGVAVNGIDQLPGAMVVTGFTEAQCAAAVAAAVNGFTPGSGYDFTAVAIGSSVYFYAPPSAGAIPNGYTIVVSDSGGVVTYTTIAFTNGSDESGVYDTVAGSRYFLNADYDGSGVSGAGTASTLNLTNAVEITKYFTDRGQQLGIFTSTVQANTRFTLQNVVRNGSITKVFVQPQAGTTQTIVKINPADFVEGDILYLQSNDPANTITVESEPAVTVGEAGNIFLMNDTVWISNRYSLLALQFSYIAAVGPSFVEIGRSTSATQTYSFTSTNTTVAITETPTSGNTEVDLEVNRPMTPTVFVCDTDGDDGTAEKYNMMLPYKTLDAALTVATAGDTIILMPGAYTCGLADGLSIVNNLKIYAHPGVSIEGALFNVIKVGFNLCGYADLTLTGTNDWSTSSSEECLIECNSIFSISAGGMLFQSGSYLVINIRKFMYLFGECVLTIDNTVGGGQHRIILTCPSIISVTSSVPGLNSIKVSDLTANSWVVINADNILLGPAAGGSGILCEGDMTTAEMDWHFSVNCEFIFGSQLLDYVIRANNNTIWAAAAANSKRCGFYVRAAVYCDIGAYTIGIYGGKLEFTGDLPCYSGTLGGVLMSQVSPVGNFPALIIMQDGKAALQTPIAKNLVDYLDTNCTVQFKNYIALIAVTNYLVDSAVPGCTYQLLSAFSTVDVNPANVTNSITGTTLVVDTAIMP